MKPIASSPLSDPLQPGRPTPVGMSAPGARAQRLRRRALRPRGSRLSVAMGFLLAAVNILAPVVAQAAPFKTYNYTGQNFVVESGTRFSASDSVTATFTIDCALAGGAGDGSSLPFADHAAAVTSFSFTASGLPALTITSADAVPGSFFRFQTDANGEIVGDYNMAHESSLEGGNGARITTSSSGGFTVARPGAAGGEGRVNYQPGVWLVAPYTVTTLADNYTTPVAGSLRAAINLANADPGAATIVFNIAGGGTINLAASAGGDRMLPILTNPNGIAINGANGEQGAITIDGGLGDRIFFIGVAPSTPAAAGGNLPSTASTSFSIANLTLQNGQARGGNGGPSDNVGAGGGAGLGGAIFVNAGALSLTNVSLSGNRAVGGNGSAANDGVANGGGGGMGGAGGAGTDNNTRSGGGGGGLGNSAKGGTLAAAGGGGIFTGATGGGAGSDSGGAGGANGGGGGAGGINGNDDSGGGGGIGGQAGQAGNTGGAGGFGGGGGSYGQSGSGDGGAGGYGGGGGGGTWGGVGGFGGGGGGNMVESNNDTGGFGAGAGGYGPSFPDFGAGGGGGGLGAGGAIFIRQGATYSFAGCVFSGNTVAGGTGGAGSGFGNPGTPGENGSAIAPDVFGLSFTQDTDGDGMSDAAEFNMAALGFNWQVNQAALVETYFANANGNGLYTTSQIQALNVGTPLLQRNPGNGLFKLTIVVKKATDLINFNPFPMTAPQTTINAQGELEFQFSPPDNAAFFRLESR